MGISGRHAFACAIPAFSRNPFLSAARLKVWGCLPNAGVARDMHGQAVERLRDFLRTLKPEARAILVAELERGVLSGEESAGNELILQELRRAIRVESQPASPRMGDAARISSDRSSPSSSTTRRITSAPGEFRGCRSSRSGNGSDAI